MKKHFDALMVNLQKPGLHNAVKRNTVRLLQFVTISKKHHGAVMDSCFQYISSPTEAAAVKAFSLTILQKLAALYPGIKPEVLLITEDRWEHETAAFKSRAKAFRTAK